MLKRIITAIIALCIFVPVLIFSNTWALPTVMSVCAMIGCYAVEKNVDTVYATGPLSKYTIKACTNIESKWFETKDEIVEELKHLLNEDCAILIKGSRAMHMDEIVDKLKEM